MESNNLCRVSGCKNIIRNKKLMICNTHSERLRRKGSIDEEIPIRGYGLKLSSEEKRIRHRQSQQRWKNKNIDLVRKYNCEYRKSGRDKLQRNKASKEWRIKNPEKYKAQYLLLSAIKKGLIVRQPCKCGNINTHGHHDDYNKPLEVIWMCASCHAKYHLKQKGENSDDKEEARQEVRRERNMRHEQEGDVSNTRSGYGP